jgi:hypothetical protein
VEQGFAEEFSVGAVNDGVRDENFGKFGERAAGSEKESHAS